MAKLYFLESFLFPRQESLSIEWYHVLTVDDDKLFHSYPWGKVAFDLLLDFMNKVFGRKGQTGISIQGFIFSILVWAYKVIPTFSTTLNFFTTQILNEVPG